MVQTNLQTSLLFYVNGKRILDENPDPEWTLAYYLRNKLSLKGTKIACGEAQCGSCTNMVSKYDPKSKSIKHFCVHSCLIPVVSLHGCAVTTSEGIGSIQNGLHPVQERLSKRHGAQCGFCTSGFVMAMYTLLRNNPTPTEEDVENAIGGNLCRCTGYRPILEAFYSFSDKKCPCGFQGECCQSTNASVKSKESVLSDWSHLRLYDSSQDPIFPTELMNFPPESLVYKGPRILWYSPTNLKSLFEVLNANPGSKIVGTAAYTGMLERLTNQPTSTQISVGSVEELRHVQVVDKQLFIGSALTICEMQDVLSQYDKNNYSDIIKLFIRTLPAIGTTQLRNYVTWVGNVASAWYISDISICLMVTKSRLQTLSVHGTRRDIIVDNNFFVDKGTVAMAKHELITSVVIPTKQEQDNLHYEYFSAKQGQRHGHDSAIVNIAACLVVDKKDMILKEATFAFGGISNRPYMVSLKPEGNLKSKKDEVWQSVMKSVEQTLSAAIDKSYGRVEYRITLATSFVFKFLLSLQQKLEGQVYAITDMPKYEPVDGIQFAQVEYCENITCVKDSILLHFKGVLSGQPAIDPVGRPISNNSIQKHTTGQSLFCDDIPAIPNELHMALVLSEVAHAKILSIDWKEACSIQGVAGFVCIDDIPKNGSNTPAMTDMVDAPVFADKEVHCVGQTIGGILAENPLIARRAAKLVKISYENLTPVLSMEEAVKQGLIFPPVHKVVRGDVEKGLAESDHVFTGTVHLMEQEHFYMEPQTCLIIPKDGNEYEIISSTQAPSYIQSQISLAIGVPSNKLVVKVKRIGGGFGGKGEQAAAAAWPAAVAALKFQRPIRHVLTRIEDITTTGKRPPFLANYKIGFKNDGSIQAMDVKNYLGSGCRYGFNAFIMAHSCENMDSGYNITMGVEGSALKTNFPYNTVFRGAGQPEGHFTMECMIEQVAQRLKMDASDIRKRYLYKNGDRSLDNLPIDHCQLDKCWEECLRLSQYKTRKVEIEKFNKENRYKKRGISMVTVKTAVGLADSLFEQGGVLVNIYLDGTVQVSHGGVEMGQGLHTKLLQVASRVLKIPIENVTTIESATDKIPNGMPTGGSIGVDVYGPAVIEACETLLRRLEPYIFKNPKGTFPDWVRAAHMDRVHLSATGFGKPVVKNNEDGKRTFKPRYYVYGVASSEVEIDCLTGDHVVLESDIVMDLAESLNPAIDIGQIEGAFIQGYGLTTMEEMLYSETGQILTNSAASYKIPNVRTVPKKFKVALLKNDAFKENIYSSKGVGEPPLTLGFSPYFAIVNAVKAARRDAGIEEPFQIDSPATPEKIRMYCSTKMC